MFIEQPPWFYRALFPGVTWRIPAEKKCVYLTFDDGPIPEVTPWVLDILDTYGIKATFFMVGDNVRKHPEVFQMVIDRGHRVYSPHMTPNGVFNVVKNYTRNGSVIVFHDSLKAERNMREAMPRAVEWLLKEGYEFKVFE